MRARVMTCLLLPLLVGGAGCLDGTDSAGDGAVLDLYLFDYPGAEVWVPGTTHGWLLRVTNPTEDRLRASVSPVGVAEARLAIAADRAAGRPWQSWNGSQSLDAVVDLDPGESAVALLAVGAYADPTVPVGGLQVDVTRGHEIFGSQEVTRSVLPANGIAVQAGDHVRTATVGVWANGTSFYTNIAALNDDPAFPAGYDRADFGGDPLPVYVYDKDRTEQPAGSKDTCHFTTIAGYNDLLTTQAAGGTGVRFLEPGEAYTRPGAEDHPLYGDALVFLNTVVAHDGPTGLTDELPAPTGACFDPTHMLPPLAAGTLPRR